MKILNTMSITLFALSLTLFISCSRSNMNDLNLDDDQEDPDGKHSGLGSNNATPTVINNQIDHEKLAEMLKNNSPELETKLADEGCHIYDNKFKQQYINNIRYPGGSIGHCMSQLLPTMKDGCESLWENPNYRSTGGNLWTSILSKSDWTPGLRLPQENCDSLVYKKEGRQACLDRNKASSGSGGRYSGVKGVAVNLANTLSKGLADYYEKQAKAAKDHNDRLQADAQLKSERIKACFTGLAIAELHKFCAGEIGAVKGRSCKDQAAKAAAAENDDDDDE